jgi:hypothetical protein
VGFQVQVTFPIRAGLALEFVRMVGVRRVVVRSRRVNASARGRGPCRRGPSLWNGGLPGAWEQYNPAVIQGTVANPALHTDRIFVDLPAFATAVPGRQMEF